MVVLQPGGAMKQRAGFLSSTMLRAPANPLAVLGALMGAGGLLLFSAEPARAQCVPTTSPASGDTVTCTGASTTPISGGASDNVTVDIETGASLETTTGDAIGLGDNGTITNDGTLRTETLGGSTISTFGNDLTVTNNGLIEFRPSGPGFTIGRGISLGGGTGHQIVNNGTIVAEGGLVGIAISGFNHIDVTNTGLIESFGPESIAIAGGQASTLINSGTIRANGTESFGTIIAVDFDDDAGAGATIDNLAGGLIEALNPFGSIDTVLAIRTGAGDDVVTNAGTINAGVDLGDGADVLEILPGGVLGTGVYSGGGGLADVVRFNATSDFTFDFNSSFFDFETGEKTGAGVLVFDGLGFFTSDFNVLDGTAILANGANLIADNVSIEAALVLEAGVLTAFSGVQVEAGGRLAGAGDISTPNLTIAGALAPGPSVGTLTVGGDVTFQSGAVFEVDAQDIAGTPTADLLTATGTALLNGGDVAVSLGTLTGATIDLQILTAGAVTGTFDSATLVSGALFRDVSLSYQPTAVLLHITTTSFCGPAVTGNQLAVCGVLDTIGTGGDAFDELVNLSTAEQAQAAFDSLSGVGHASSALLAQYAHSLFARTTLAGRFGPEGGRGPVMVAQAEAPRTDASYGGADSDLRFWGRLFSAFGEIDGAPSVPATDFDLGGLSMGVEKSSDAWTVGFGFGYAQIGADVGLQELDLETVQGQLYAGYTGERFYFTTVLGAGHHAIDSARTVVVGAASNTTFASYDGLTLGAAAEIGMSFTQGAWSISPFAGLDFVHFRQSEFTETGAAFGNLTAPEFDSESLRAIVGLRLAMENEGLVPALRVAYARELLDESAFSAAFASAPGTAFVVDGAEFGDDRLLVGAGLSGRLSDRTSAALTYDGEFSSSDEAHAIAARLIVQW